MNVKQGERELDLVELSDRAWEVIDPIGLYEEEERHWVEALTAEGRSIAGLPALGRRLERVAETVGSPHDHVPTRLTALLMEFLASHEEIHELSDGVLHDAIEDSYAPTEVPPDIAAFLAERRDALDAHVRGHGAEHPRRRFHSKRTPPDDAPTG